MVDIRAGWARQIHVTRSAYLEDMGRRALPAHVPMALRSSWTLCIVPANEDPDGIESCYAVQGVWDRRSWV